LNRRIAAALACCALALSLAGCLLSPGKFVSTLDLRRDGHFSFAYKGEIFTIALSKLAEMGRAANKPFEPSECTNDEGQTRKCTAAEVAEQKKSWEESRAADTERGRKEAEQFKQIFGGIDPSNPKAAEELAARLRRQAGWRSVVYKGDGLFEVDFAISGRLGHDFIFPTVERFPMANSFVHVNLRGDRTVRIDAPGFAPSNSGTPFSQIGLLGMAMSDKMGKDGKDAMPGVPTLDGTFVVTTDGAVLANNTDEGPQKDPAGQRLGWQVNVRAPAAPTALIRLDPQAP
jgi:hypothetical protein